MQESYIKDLENALNDAQSSSNVDNSFSLDSRLVQQERPEHVTSPTTVNRSNDPLVENSTAELFVSRLKQIQESKRLPGPVDGQAELTSINSDAQRELTRVPTYEYFALNFDTLCKSLPHITPLVWLTTI